MSAVRTQEPQIERRSPPEDGLGVIAHCLLDETGAAGVLVAGRNGSEELVRVSAGKRLAFLDEPNGMLAYALRASVLTTTRMPAPEGSGFGELAVAAMHTPTGRRGAVFLAFDGSAEDSSESLLWTLDNYCRLAATCLEDNAGLKRLVAAATMDGLTGCLNHSALRLAIDSEVERATRYGLKLSICFLDLDHFKSVNDQEGHEAGNEVLSRLGATLRQAARKTDVVGRYGGDEFILVLPETSLRSAIRLAKRLRGALATMTTPAGTPLSVSAGVASWRMGLTPSALVEAADVALLNAKRNESGLELAS